MEIFDMPYAKWLEESIQHIVASDPMSLCIVAIGKTGNVLTGYYNCDATDKAVIAHNIQSDIVMDIIHNNPEAIRAVLEEDE